MVTFYLSPLVLSIGLCYESSRILMWAGEFLRELPPSLDFHGEGKAWSCTSITVVSAFISAHFLVTFYRCLQSVWLWSKGTSNFPQCLPLPKCFLQWCCSFYVAPSPLWGQPCINFMCPEFHVAILSPRLSWFLSFSWADPVSSFSQGWSLVQFYVLRSKVVCFKEAKGFLLLFLLPSPSPSSFLASSWGLRL